MKNSENKISENFINKYNYNKNNNFMKFNSIEQNKNKNIHVKYENFNEFELQEQKQNILTKKKYLSIKHKKYLSPLNIKEIENNKNNNKNNDKNIDNKNISRNNIYGLKEISYKVKQIIKKKGCTTYKEISDEIVNEINQKGANDKKNIRRRIYDSLNVMKSMKLFKKDKSTKKIMWNLDLENFSNKNNDFNNNNNLIEYCNLNNNLLEKNEKELKKINDLINKLEFKINLKKQKFSALQNEMISLNKFIERNKKINDLIDENKKLYFPFIIIELNENNNNNININMNENQNKIHFAIDSFKKIYADLDSISKINSNNLN